MIELPLFPLNTVLFPGIPLRLHIFEERYKKMMERLVELREPFGVVLIHQGQEAHGPLPDPYRVGCTARIMIYRSLPQGHYNLASIGEERFRILKIDRFSEPYLVGSVEKYPLIVEDEQVLSRAQARLLPWLERYFFAMAGAKQGRVSLRQLPNEPLPMAYLAAGLVNIPLEEKQELWSVESALEFIKGVTRIYRREVALIKTMLSGSSGKEIKVFSRN